jgi:hypothetical protein
MGHRQEPVFVQALVPEATVEAEAFDREPQLVHH